MSSDPQTWRLSNQNLEYIQAEAARLGLSLNSALNVTLARLIPPETPPPRYAPTNCQTEPHYPNHDTVTFSIRAPEHTAHPASELCGIEEPHEISKCGEFAKPAPRRIMVPNKNRPGSPHSVEHAYSISCYAPPKCKRKPETDNHKFNDHLHECDHCCTVWMKASETQQEPEDSQLCRIGRRLRRS
jgi:hypothetical protein